MPTAFTIAIISTVWDLDLRATARRARAEGFSAIQLEARSPQLEVAALSASGRREVRQILAGLSLQIVGLRISLDGKGLGPRADIDAILAMLDPILESAAGLQSPLVCVDLGPLPEPIAEEKPASTISPDQAGLLIIPQVSQPAAPIAISPRPFDAPFGSSVDGALHELGRRADRYGVVVAFNSELASFAAVGRALAAAACPWFGLDFDPVAMLRDQWPADEIFSRLGNLIRHVRARDALLGADKRTKPATIGTGSVQWNDLLAKLTDAAYSRWLTIDPTDLPQRAAAAAAGAAYLKQIQS